MRNYKLLPLLVAAVLTIAVVTLLSTALLMGIERL